MATKIPTVKFFNGYECPIIGLGTWESPPGLLIRAVKEALEIGYRHIDCAYVYQNEREVGEALRVKFAKGTVKRKDLFITSKLWCTFHRPDLVEGALRTSLKNLGLDYLDLYLMHWPQAYQEGGDLYPRDAGGKIISSDVDYVDTWQAMEQLVDKGLVRSIGLSHFNKSQIERVLEVAKIRPAVLQIEVHPYMNQHKLVEYCKSQDIVVTAYSPLGSPDKPWANPDDPRLIVIADKYKKTVPQMIYRSLIDRGFIVIPKSVLRSRLAKNFNIFDFQLNESDLQQIYALDSKSRFCGMGDTHVNHYPFNDEY